MMRVILLFCLLGLLVSSNSRSKIVYTVDEYHDMFSILSYEFGLKKKVAIQNPWLLKSIVYHNFDVTDFRHLDTGKRITLVLPESYPRFNPDKVITLNSFDSFVKKRFRLTQRDLKGQKKPSVRRALKIDYTAPVKIDLPPVIEEPVEKEIEEDFIPDEKITAAVQKEEDLFEKLKKPELELEKKMVYYCVKEPTGLEALLEDEFQIERDMMFYDLYVTRIKGLNDHITDFNDINEKTLIKVLMPKGMAYKSRLQANKFFLTKTTQKETTLTEFIKENLGDQIYYIENDDIYIKDIKKINPKIKFWSVIPAGTTIKYYIPIAISNSCSNPQEKAEKELEDYKKMVKKEGKKVSRMNWSGFGMMSSGSFSETYSGSSLKSSQNSPLTLGVSLRYNHSPETKFSTSLYMSKLTGLSNSSESVFVPSEFGVTAYYESPNAFKSLGWYAGYDYEAFSTFNTDDLIDGSTTSIKVREQTIHYGTFGLSFNFKIFNNPVFMRTSGSFTLLSAASSGDTFKGFKTMFFGATPISDNWALIMLWKRHQLTGPTSLVIQRLGVGISKSF